MKLGPIEEDHGRFMIELIFSPSEIKALGGEEAVQRMCEKACEENLRRMKALSEYMQETEGGFRGGSKPEHLAD